MGEHVCLPSSAGKSRIGLLVRPGESLESGLALFVDLIEAMEYRSGCRLVRGAVDDCSHVTVLSTECQSGQRILLRPLDWLDIETKTVPSFVSTADVKGGITFVSVARDHGPDTGTSAHLTDGICSRGICNSHTDTFRITEICRLAEFDLGHPDCAGDVHPVVVRCRLQSFSRIRWPTFLHLFSLVLGRKIIR